MRVIQSHSVVLAFLSLLAVLFTAGPAAAKPLSLSPNNIANGTQYTSYTETFTATGGASPYSWSYTGTLPTGLTFTPSGSTATLSGIPTVASTFNFTIILTDSAPTIVSNSYSVTISAGPCTFTGTNIGQISFDPIDPFTSSQIYGNVITQIPVTCTKAATVTVNPASGWTMVSGVNSIPYTLAFAASGGPGSFNLLTDLASNILQANYQNAPAGTYSNSSDITLTVSWTAPAGSITAVLPAGKVSGTVQKNCSVSGTPSLNFGTLDAVTNAGGATVVSSIPPVVKCTMGATVTVTEDGGLYNSGGQDRMKNSASDYINYNLGFTTPLTGAGATTDIGGSGVGYLSLTASIPAGALNNAPAGAYSDTVTLTFTY